MVDVIQRFGFARANVGSDFIGRLILDQVERIRSLQENSSVNPQLTEMVIDMWSGWNGNGTKVMVSDLLCRVERIDELSAGPNPPESPPEFFPSQFVQKLPRNPSPYIRTSFCANLPGKK
ncbi:hypothetical protein KQX54_009556 [Cotesia glomerata]|uniref:Uncharacterized protein n=1 Tax=Cotesia glomerata TaxID=32391 RepID=A0AAV7J3Z9_COTGL|nr:hypothetical protein KQX54_009556 [Cotesia glomerata]